MGKKFVYADNAATTKLDSEALKEMLPYLTEDYSNPSQPYSFSRNSKKALQKARTDIAECINAEPEEIYFTSGGSESDNWAIKGAALSFEKQRIITSEVEHHAVLKSCEFLKEFDYTVNYLPVSKNGVVSVNRLKELINDNCAVVSVMMANNEIGTIQPIKEISNIVHSKNVLLHTDAVQAVGHIVVDVKDLGVDMLSASAHKFNGPRGTGFLFIKRGTKIHSFINGGAQEYGLRAGTENIANIVGMAAALKNNCKNMKSNTMYLQKLENQLITSLKNNNLDFLCNSSAEKIPGNISISFKNCSGEVLLHRLDLMGICVSTGSACNGASTEISHVIRAISVPKSYALGTIRISLGKYNTLEEVHYLSNALSNIVKYYNK